MTLNQEERAAKNREFTLNLLLVDQLAIQDRRSRSAAIKKYLKRVKLETKVPDIYEYVQFMLKLDNRDLQRMVERLFYGIVGSKHQLTLDHHNTLHDTNKLTDPNAEASNAKTSPLSKRKFTIPGRER